MSEEDRLVNKPSQREVYECWDVQLDHTFHWRCYASLEHDVL